MIIVIVAAQIRSNRCPQRRQSGRLVCVGRPAASGLASWRSACGSPQCSTWLFNLAPPLSTELLLSALASGHFLRGEMTSRKGFRIQRSVWSDRHTLMRQSAAIRFPSLRRAIGICTLRSLNTLNGCLLQYASGVLTLCRLRFRPRQLPQH